MTYPPETTFWPDVQRAVAIVFTPVCEAVTLLMCLEIEIWPLRAQ
jgi:hypothetical protein